MIRRIAFSIVSSILLWNVQLSAQCVNDTTFSDVIFLIDNSGSIEASEYVAFSNIIRETVNKVQTSCQEAQVAVVHYGGAFGQQTIIEYPLSNNNVINTIDRQFCTSLNQFGFCDGGGGDDLNAAIGNVIGYLNSGALDHDVNNNLSLVIFTDAFDGSDICNQPNCSILKPFTNIDMLKTNFDASVTVVGVSDQVNEPILQIYASPGGTYDDVPISADCAGTFDGCVTPRKYVPIDFNSDVNAASDNILACVSCEFTVATTIDVVLSASESAVCPDINQEVEINAAVSGGVAPYSYSWVQTTGSGSAIAGSGTSMIATMPATAATYEVTVTDNNSCFTVASISIGAVDCCAGFVATAGTDQTICAGETATLVASSNRNNVTYSWDNGLSDGSTQLVTPVVTTTYTVTASDTLGCMTMDQVTITVDNNCAADCTPDTTFTDVIFLIDNSGSIDSTEFAQFENVILGSLDGIQASCPSSRRAVVHYGGSFGLETMIEYPLGRGDITSVQRQFCTSLNQFGLCEGGGGDDLNNAVGHLMNFLMDGSLNRDPGNELKLVIFTDAFGFSTDCPQPNCSKILPTTNIDAMKSSFGVDVTVVGMSSQAEESALGIYASPGGTFNSPLFSGACASSFDGCALPRKYIQVEFNTPPSTVAAEITQFLECTIEVVPVLSADAGEDQTICGNLGGAATLTANTDSTGLAPFQYAWSDGQNAISINVAPDTFTTYFVTITDANLCTAVDSVNVDPILCDDCDAFAGTPWPPQEICLEDNGQAILIAERNDSVVVPPSFEIVYILTNSDLKILDYSIGTRPFTVNESGLYRIHTLVAEVTDRNSPDYIDLNIIERGSSDLFLIVNCVENHGVCADFDFVGRVWQVRGPEAMLCMRFENSIALCSDGIDNDRDGLVDCGDEDCKSLINCLENTLIACNDLTDNDGDGLVDCVDPDCWEFTVCFERGDNCNDGIDNDGDGLVDCADNSCDGSTTCEENTVITCIDGRDNDNDGLTDCQEAACAKYIVCSEYTVEACGDGIDNDFDGLIDCNDSQCVELLGNACIKTEDAWDLCNDGIDNDGDGLVDCADSDCMTESLFLAEANIDALIEVRNATCPNNNDGTILIRGIAVSPGHSYSLDGGSTFTDQTFYENLNVGPYAIAIRSENGCVLFADVEVRGQACIEICNNNRDDDQDGFVDCADSDCRTIDPYAPQIVNITASNCPALNSGSFSIAGLPGNVDYSINGVTYQSLARFSGLEPGDYTLTYRDIDGCYGGTIVTIPRGNDLDEDGVCDDEDDCPAFDNFIIGRPCDDGDECTIDDVYTENCRCEGTFQDADGDTVCDADDVCPSGDDTLIGTPCDDGNVCTINDVYLTNCLCIGTATDSDFDNTCDAEDICPGLDDRLIGQPCDDGDPCTIDDTYVDCECRGTFADFDGDGVCDAEDVCPSGDDTLIGQPCDDGNVCTVNDVYLTNCLCRGTTVDSDFDNTCDAEDICPGLDDRLIGQPCDDGDPCTNNDTYVDCDCVGTFADFDGDGVCDAEDVCPSGDDTLIGQPCDDGDACTIDDVYTSACNCVGTFQDSDDDGICDAEEVACPEISNPSFVAISSDCSEVNGRIELLNFDAALSYSLTPQSGFFANGVFDSVAVGIYTMNVADDCSSISIENVEVALQETCAETGAATTTTQTMVPMNLSVMLQGACRLDDGGVMNTTLNEGGYLPGQEPKTFFGKRTPAGQPFNQGPWFYEGTEGHPAADGSASDYDELYDEEVVDWVLVGFRTGTAKSSEIKRAAALLYSDRSIEFLDDIYFDNIDPEGYYITIEHRNHLPVMSHEKVKVDPEDGMFYDFAKQDSYRSILGVGQIQDEYGYYCMVAGNGELIVELSSDIDVNVRDLTSWIQNNGLNSSYFLEDYDMNGDINIKDRILWEKNNGLFTTLETK